MKTIPITLRTTEVIDGQKRRPGDVVQLAEADPVAVKTKALEAVDEADRSVSSAAAKVARDGG